MPGGTIHPIVSLNCGKSHFFSDFAISCINMKHNLRSQKLQKHEKHLSTSFRCSDMFMMTFMPPAAIKVKKVVLSIFDVMMMDERKLKIIF